MATELELTTVQLSTTLSADAVADMARSAQYDAAYRAEVAEQSATYDWSGFSL